MNRQHRPLKTQTLNYYSVKRYAKDIEVTTCCAAAPLQSCPGQAQRISPTVPAAGQVALGKWFRSGAQPEYAGEVFLGGEEGRGTGACLPIPAARSEANTSLWKPGDAE